MTKIIQRHDTSANWTSVNPVLAAGEMGVETDTNKFKFGDGVTAWADLAYAAGEGGSSGTTLTSTDGTTTYNKLALGDTLSVKDTSTKELNKLTQTGGTLNSELEFTGASGASLKMTEKYSLSTADSWEFQIKYKHNGGGPNPCVFGYASGSDFKTPAFILEGGSFKFFLSSNGGSWNINSSGSDLTPQAGTIYYLKVGFTGSQYYVKYNTTGWSNEFTTQWTLNSTAKVYCSDYFMLMNLSLNSGYYNTGTMYLQDTALIINGTEVWRGVNITPGQQMLNANLDEVTKQIDTIKSELNNKAEIFGTQQPLTIIPKGEQNVNINGGKLTNDYIYYCKNPDDNTYGQLTSKELIDFSKYSSYEIGIKFEYQPSTDSKLKYVFEAPGSFLFGYWNSNMQISIYPVKTYQQLSLTFQTGTIYYLKFSYDGSSYKLQYNTTGWNGTFSNLSSITSSTRVDTTTGNTIFGGKNSSQYYLPGGLYVLESYYQLGNEPRVPLWLHGPEVRMLAANPATTSSLGVVQPDGTSITVSDTGIISGQDVKTFTGYSATGTLVLKSINGVLQWVAEA